jgi:hypothetical protein
VVRLVRARCYQQRVEQMRVREYLREREAARQEAEQARKRDTGR